MTTKPKAKAAAAQSTSPDAGLASLLKMAEKNAATKGKMSRASEAKEDYVDFVDITSKSPRPCILLEYLFSTRGLSTGRVVKIDAEEATGKSSLLYLLYGGAQRGVGAYILNHETERALMPPDRIARLGCDPSKLMLYRPGDLDDCLKSSKQFVLNVRQMLDKPMAYPIFIGIDSVSSVAGTECDPVTGEPLDAKGKGLGYHARRFSEFFRDELGFLAANRVVLLGTGQSKTGFNTLPGGRQMASGKTALAEGTFKFHSSWIISMKRQNSEKPGGEFIVCTSAKNKMGPKRREIKLLLYNDERCWDFAFGTASLLFSTMSPFDAKDKWTSNAGRYTHARVGKGSSLCAEDFVDAFYQNEELVMQCREAWKVRGFGLPFENIEMPWDQDSEDETPLMDPSVPEVASETNKLK